MTAEFIQRHIGPSKDEQAEMLTDLGLTSVDELVRQVVQILFYFVVMVDYQKVVMSKKHSQN